MMSGSGESPGPVVVSRIADPVRRRYVARVDSICRQVDPERRSEQERVGRMTGPHGAMMAYDDSTAVGWRELHRIEAVHPPAGDAAVLKANVIEPIRAQLMLRGRMAKALGATDLPWLRLMRARMDDMSRAMMGFARGYGFRVCGED